LYTLLSLIFCTLSLDRTEQTIWRRKEYETIEEVNEWGWTRIIEREL
jgi:hypothetical protein